MASTYQVKQYLAYWLQLGKKVAINNGDRRLLPEKIIVGDRYSEEFEAVWQQILSPNSGDCYIEGTDETIAELLTAQWEIVSCSRCVMPIAMRTQGMPANYCPCSDLSTWPNSDLPHPRSPVSSESHLSSIRDRILRTYKPDLPHINKSEMEKPEPPISLDLPPCRQNIA